MEPSPVHNSEVRLLRAAAENDRAAQRELFDRHRDAAYRVAYRVTGRAEDALDVVQDAFITAFARLQQFQGEASFKTWFLRIVTNKALDLLRTRRVRLAVPLEPDDGGATDQGSPPEAGPGARLERAELQERVRQALAALPPEQRAVMSLYAAGEMTYGEIAEVLGVPVGTVMSRLYHARRRLREQLPDLVPGGERGALKKGER